MSSTTQHVSRIRCAHCKGYHIDVAHVLACSRGELVLDDVAALVATLPEPTFPGPGYSDNPHLDDDPYGTGHGHGRRDEALFDALADQLYGSVADMAAEEAKHDEPAPALSPETVPEGRYAIDFEGQLRFFKVDRPAEGRWAGYVFVKEQAGDDLYPVRGPRRDRVLTAIAAADPVAATLRYGLELGKCGVCGRTLTDPESRAAGIGPICAQRRGWEGLF